MQIPEILPHDPPPKGKIRTHLANERTYLAWARTGFTAIALGIAAAQLLDARHAFGLPINELLSGMLVLFGLAVVLVGRWRYRLTAIGIRDDEYRTHRRGLEIVWVGTLVVAVIALAFVFLQ